MTEGAALRVFISYARRDCTAFAEELLAGLEVAGFDPFLDRHDIAAGEDWEARLGGLIQAADTVVFVVSPAAVASKRCAWEVERADALSKRILPVVAIDVSETQTPPGLKRLNYIFFTEGHSFARALGDLAKALRTNLDWVREHTRLGELAARWRDRDRADVLLLRGSELDAAKAWLNEWSAGTPEPTDLHRALIRESESAELGRQSAERKQLNEMAAAQEARAEALKRLSRRTALGLTAAAGLVTTAGFLAYWGVNAEHRFREARARSVETLIARESARTDLAGQFTAYAAAPGEPAADNSLYSDSVLTELHDADASFQAALARAHAIVYRDSANGGLRTPQRPYFSSDLNGDLYLRRHSGARRMKALVVSVDEFAGRRLFSVVPEARAWATFLSECGFECEELLNPSADALSSSIGRVFHFPPPQSGAIEPRDPIIPVGMSGAGLAPPADTLAFFFLHWRRRVKRG